MRRAWRSPGASLGRTVVHEKRRFSPIGQSEFPKYQSICIGEKPTGRSVFFFNTHSDISEIQFKPFSLVAVQATNLRQSTQEDRMDQGGPSRGWRGCA